MSARTDRSKERPLPGGSPWDLNDEGARPPAFADEALALRFAEQHASGLRYVDVWGRWLTWDGTRWQFDDTLAAYDLVREACRTASAECNRESVAAALASAKTVAAVERLARSDRRLAATADQWDVDPWLLNTPLGIVDLRTGKRSVHRADAWSGGQGFSPTSRRAGRERIARQRGRENAVAQEKQHECQLPLCS